MTTKSVSLAYLRFMRLSNYDYVLEVAKVLKRCPAAIHSFMIRLYLAPIISYTVTGTRAVLQTPIQAMIFHISGLLNAKEKRVLGIPERLVPVKFVNIGRIEPEDRAPIMVGYLNKAIRYINKYNCPKITPRIPLVDPKELNVIQLRQVMDKIISIEHLYREEFYFKMKIDY